MTAPHVLSLTLRPELDAPYTARALLAALLPHWRVDADLCDRALLVVSELVANVAAHTSQAEPLHLEVELHADRLVLCVVDCDPCLPVPRRADELAEGGRGLQLVAALTRSWSAEPCASGGKRVRAVLDRHPAPVA